jgi:Fur family zinc uptake transcriptional regulator
MINQNSNDGICEIISEVDYARQRCTQLGEKLTPLREEVFLAACSLPHGVLKAYDILSVVQKKRSDAKVAPPTVYRSLDFLVSIGLLHRVDALNGFVRCTKDHCHPYEELTLLMLCSVCHKVEESHHLLDFLLPQLEEQYNFSASLSQQILLLGHCHEHRS